MKTNDEELQNFSEETLNEMAMENVEGGVGIDLELGTKINNCSKGNCASECGVIKPIE